MPFLALLRTENAGEPKTALHVLFLTTFPGRKKKKTKYKFLVI